MTDRAAIRARLLARWHEPPVFIVCGFGSGFSPWAPGTAGSLVALAIWWLVIGALPLLVQVLIAALVFGLGTWLTAIVMRRHKVGDAGAVVIDEFVGLWIVLLGAPLEPWVAVAGFVLFRLFDIAKPWPIGLLERRVPGALGVMVDDVAAGLIGLTVLQFTLWLLAAL